MISTDRDYPTAAYPVIGPSVPAMTSPITDPARLPWQPLLTSLQVDDGDTLLGLGLTESSTSIGVPSDLAGGTRLSGTRRHRQVEIRIAVGEFGWRNCAVMNTWILVAGPTWSARGNKTGQWIPDSDTPGPMADMLTTLSPVKALRRGVSLRAGQRGLVLSRAVKGGHPQGYLYDLWLAERLADTADAPAIPVTDLTNTRMPYHMGTRRGIVG